MVWFRLSVGREKQADPKWLIPEICKQGGITKREIGAIRIFDTETKFEIVEHAAAAFAESVGKITSGIYITTTEAPGAGAPPRRDGGKPFNRDKSKPFQQARASAQDAEEAPRDNSPHKKPWDKKPWDKKSGDKTAGDKKPWDKKPWDKKAGDKKFGDKKPWDKKAGDKHAHKEGGKPDKKFGSNPDGSKPFKKKHRKGGKPDHAA